MAIIPSSSYGFATVLNNVLPKKNGKAIITEEEFPSGYFALKRWCDLHDNELTVVGPDAGLIVLGEHWNEKLLAAIDEDTSMVLLSAIHWMSGLKFDLKAIGEKCAAVGAVFIVDGSQSVGALPMDVAAFKIDALICAGYKWLFGPYSLGAAYIGDKFKQGIPLEESWMNRTNAKSFTNLTSYDPAYEPAAGRYNVGQTSNFILMPILKTGLQQINDWTIPAIQEYSKGLIQPLLQYLEQLGAVFESPKYFSNHLFDLRLPETVPVDQLKRILEKKKIYLSIRGKYLRASVNVFNDENDIQELMNAIQITVEGTQK